MTAGGPSPSLVASSRRVVVVGGGLAGLRAAWGLARAGHVVTVLERRPAAGGRAASTVDAGSGEPVDTGQHAFMGAYRATRRWLDDLGTGGLLRFQRRLRVPYACAGAGTVEFRAAPLPAPLHLVAGAMALPGLGAGELMGLLRLAPDILFRPGAARDHMTVSAWEDARRVPPAVRRYLLDPLAVAAVNEDPGAASLLPFLRVIRILAWRGNPACTMGFATTGLSDLYVPAAVRAVEAAGGSLRTGAWVARIVVRDGRAAGVELAGGEEIEAEAVVLAVPPWDIPAMIPGIGGLEPLAAAAARFQPSPIVTVHLWWDAPVMAGEFAGFPDGPFQWVFNRTAIVGAGRTGGQHLCVVRSGARDLLGRKPDELAALAAEDLRSRFPAARDARVARSRIVWETKATVSLVPGTDGHRPGAATGLPGLVLAGDWTRTGYPATIEGAVVSGETAAGTLISSWL